MWIPSWKSIRYLNRRKCKKYVTPRQPFFDIFLTFFMYPFRRINILLLLLMHIYRLCLK